MADVMAYPDPLSEVRKTVAGRIGLWMAKHLMRIQAPQLNGREQQDIDLLADEEQEAETLTHLPDLGGWLLRILYNDPKRRFTIGVVAADTAGLTFPRHTHGVEEWVLCYEGKMEITDDVGVHVLTPESPMYMIGPGGSHSGRCLEDHTRVLFVNRPASV